MDGLTKRRQDNNTLEKKTWNSILFNSSKECIEKKWCERETEHEHEIKVIWIWNMQMMVAIMSLNDDVIGINIVKRFQFIYFVIFT